MKKILLSLACASMVLSGCGAMSNLAKGALAGTGAGAAAGAAAGALIAKDGKGAAIGAAIGAVVGATAGSIIGDRMDAKAKELAAIEGASIDTVYDANNLKAIKVTFDNGILFKTSSSELSDVSKASLKDFADKMKDFEQTDILVQGHTDHTGTREYNEKLSVDRANSVARYLNNCGMSKDRFTVEGLAWDKMVVDTEKACQENRRVEVYITANEDMIKKAEKEAKNAQ